MTVLFGGLAGRRFQLTFTSEFFIDDQGVLVARLNRNMAGGALKGGALGATKTENAFVELVNVITTDGPGGRAGFTPSAVTSDAIARPGP